jgi:hypothetical protein
MRKSVEDQSFRLEQKLAEHTAVVECRLNDLKAQQLADRADAVSRFESIDARLSALESAERKPIPPVPRWSETVHVHGPRAGSSASSSRGAGSAAAAAAASEVSDDVWVPSCGFLRGWSPYEKDMSNRKNGLSKAEAESLILRVKSACIHADWRIVSRCAAPSFRNYQVVVHFFPSASADSIYGFAKAVNQDLKNPPLLEKGGQVYLALDQPLWKRERNQQMRRVADACTVLKPDVQIELDWSAGALWYNVEPAMLLGHYSHKGRSWTFYPSTLARMQLTEEAIVAHLKELDKE